jgi:hypothetical protein
MLFSSAAPVAAFALTGCAGQLANIQTQWAAFIDQVNAILATGCSTVLPAFTVTATTIELVVNALYPGVGAAVGGIVGAVQTVANAICNVKPTASARRGAVRRGSIIGVITVNGKTIPIQVNSIASR